MAGTGKGSLKVLAWWMGRKGVRISRVVRVASFRRWQHEPRLAGNKDISFVPFWKKGVPKVSRLVYSTTRIPARLHQTSEPQLGSGHVGSLIRGHGMSAVCMPGLSLAVAYINLGLYPSLKHLSWSMWVSHLCPSPITRSVFVTGPFKTQCLQSATGPLCWLPPPFFFLTGAFWHFIFTTFL